MGLGEKRQQETKAGRVACGALGIVAVSVTAALGVVGRLMRSWTGILVLIGGLLYLAPFGGSLIRLATGTVGPLDFITGKLVGPSQFPAITSSRSYGDSPQERLNEQVELYLRKSRPQDPNSITLVGDARVLSAEQQADGNFKLEIEATSEIAHKAFGLSLGTGQQRIQLLAVEHARDHSVTIYSMLAVGS